jgi:hypothetical protein
MDTWTIDTARLVAIAQWYTLEPVNVVVATIADGYLAYTVEGYFKTIVLDPSLFEDSRTVEPFPGGSGPHCEPRLVHEPLESHAWASAPG